MRGGVPPRDADQFDAMLYGRQGVSTKVPRRAGPATRRVLIATLTLAVVAVGPIAAVGAASSLHATGAGTAVSRGQFSALLASGRKAAEQGNAEFAEILGIAAPGGGEMLKIHTRFNAAKGIEASGIEEDSGFLRSDAKAVRGISVQSLVIGTTAYIRPAQGNAKWTKEIVKPTRLTAASLPKELLALAAADGVTRIAKDASGSSYRIDLHASDLAVLRAFGAQLPAHALQALSKSQVSLLSAMTFSLPDLVVKLDRQNRVTLLEGGGTLTETRAAAKAQRSFYPTNGVVGVVLLQVVYRYGGALRITAPSAAEIRTSGKLTR